MEREPATHRCLDVDAGHVVQVPLRLPLQRAAQRPDHHPHRRWEADTLLPTGTEATQLPQPVFGGSRILHHPPPVIEDQDAWDALHGNLLGDLRTEGRRLQTGGEVRGDPLHERHFARLKVGAAALPDQADATPLRPAQGTDGEQLEPQPERAGNLSVPQRPFQRAPSYVGEQGDWHPALNHPALRVQVLREVDCSR